MTDCDTICIYLKIKYNNNTLFFMKKIQNKKWFSLIFAMWLVLSISITIIYLLEYVMPFAKDTKWIEFSSNAFYQSNSAIEDALYYVATNNLWDEDSNDLVLGWTFDSNISGITGNGENTYYDRENDDDPNTDFGYDIEARWDTIPPDSEWNSEFDPDWNRLAIGEPVQLEIGEGNWNSATITFRIPNTGFWNWSDIQTMPWWIIAWQLSSENGTLNSGTDSTIGRDVLKSWNGDGKEFNFINQNIKGKTLNDEEESFSIFYNNCNATGEKCTLKLSVINDLILDDSHNTPVPYIEYKIEGANNIPLRYTRIRTSGYSNGFKKDLYIKIPQQTVNEAFDFTVFQ